jgi:cytoskeletal protein CcmA (bactofilin family)
VVFRKDSKVDAFQRQISALRQQLGGEPDVFSVPQRDRDGSGTRHQEYRTDLPELSSIAPGRTYSVPDFEQEVNRPEQVARPAIPAVDLQTSVIAHSTAWTGTVESSGSLHVHGRVEGSLTARDDIFIAEEADVDGTIRAANVIIAGNVHGSIDCADRFEVLPRARIAADVQAPVIVVHEGAVIAGKISMTRSGEAKGVAPSPAGARAAHGGD